MSEDIDAIIYQTKSQFVSMRTHYDQELENIESEFNREREAVLKKNDEEVKFLFKEHRDTE